MSFFYWGRAWHLLQAMVQGHFSWSATSPYAVGIEAVSGIVTLVRVVWNIA
jgi:hypothetical protein